MGRLKRPIFSRRARQVVLAWLLPVLLTGGLLFGLHSLAGANPPSADELALYLEDHALQVDTQVREGYEQIYYWYNDGQIFITSAAYNHTNPMASDEYVAWEGLVNGHWQVFLYNVLTKALTQVTTLGTNEAIFLRDNTITWQHWDGQTWQIMYYDGTETRAITDDAEPSVRASTDGEQVIYAQQFSPDSWKAQAYDIDTGEITTIREGDTVSTAYPQFSSDGGITTSFIPQ